MQVNRTALWILMAACCVPSLAWTWSRALRRGRRGTALAEATMAGLGVGLGAATVLLLAAAIVVRLG